MRCVDTPPHTKPLDAIAECEDQSIFGVDGVTRRRVTREVMDVDRPYIDRHTAGCVSRETTVLTAGMIRRGLSGMRRTDLHREPTPADRH